jgi:hypothetical protein
VLGHGCFAREERQLTLLIRARVVNETCTFIITIINVDDFCRLGGLAARSDRLHEFSRFSNNGIELGVCERTRRRGVTTGSLTPSRVTKTSLAHGVFAGGEIESPREGYHLAFASTGHCNGQCPGGNESQRPLHLSMIRTALQALYVILTEAAAKPNPPIAVGVGLS